MKKLFIMVAMAMLFVPATASAFEVVIPYFLDGGRLVGSEPEPTSIAGGAAFITIANLTNDTLRLGVVYTGQNGVDATPVDNTFEINPRSSFGFRPVRTDFQNEKFETDNVTDWVPNALAAGTFNRDAFGNGGTGGVRLILVNPAGSSSVSDYPDFANWGPAPFASLLNQYIFYSWALAGSGLEAGFISVPLEK